MNELLERCPHLFQAPAVYLVSMPVEHKEVRRAYADSDSCSAPKLEEMTEEQVNALIDKARAEIAANNALHFVDVAV